MNYFDAYLIEKGESSFNGIGSSVEKKYTP